MSKYICIDIGGTAIKYGLATADGNLLEKGSMLTKISEDGTSAIPAKIAQIADACCKRERVSGIAICSPGVVDAEKGSIVSAGINFPNFAGMMLKDEIEKRTSLPCSVENDVNAAGLGEAWIGAARGMRNVFCLCVGTGIGGSILLDGHLVHGAGNSAGELGFLPLRGEDGILDQLGSAAQIVRDVAKSRKMEPSKLRGEEIFAWAKAGETDAIEAIDRMARRLAQGIASVCYILDPEAVILGGGIMAQRDYLLPRLNCALDEEIAPAIRGHVTLKFAALGNDAGMIGALRHFLQQRENKNPCRK